MFPVNFIQYACNRYPERIAVTDDERELSYAELWRVANALAFGLQALVGKNRLKVGICCFNSMEHVVTLMAVHAMGAVMVPFNPRYARHELHQLVSYAEPDLIVCDQACAEQVSGLGIPLIIGEHTENSGDLPSCGQLIDTHSGKKPTWPEVTPEDAWAIKFTGGSSGIPKGVVQSFRLKSTLISNLLFSFEFDGNDVQLCAAPISHAVGSLMDPIFARGGKNRLIKTTDAETLLNCMEQEKITTMFVPPTLVYNLLEAGKSKENWDFSSLKHAISGGAPISPSKAAEASEFFQGGLEMMYGQSEMPLVMSVMRAQDLNTEARYSSAGRVSPYVQLEVMDPEGTILPKGEQGEIVAKSDLMMSGYLDMPEKTAETIIDGWLHTGDVGLVDEEGFLHIKDRIREVIISGGFNIYPSDVEAAIMLHPSVRVAAAVGLQDDKWGERVEAAVELLPGKTISVDELIGFSKEKLGSIKAPKKIHFVENLPRSSVGKVSRKDVKTLLES